MPADTKWGNVKFNMTSHAYLLASVKADLLDIFHHPEKHKSLYKDKNGETIEFKDISCQRYRIYKKNDALQPFTANSFGPHFKRVRDKIGKWTRCANYSQHLRHCYFSASITREIYQT